MENNNLNNEIDKLKSEYNQVSLSFSERENIKRAVFQTPVATPSPIYSIPFYLKAGSYAFATILLIGSPMAFAAQKSLPGEILYPVKTNINESVVEIFVPTAEKENYHKTLLAKRAFEIKKLSEKGEKLNDEQIEDVESAIENSVSEIISEDDTEERNDQDIIQNYQDVISVLEFSEKLISKEDSEENKSRIKEFKDKAEKSLMKHVEDILDDEKPEESVDKLIKDAKEIIEKIPEDKREDLKEEVEEIEDIEVVDDDIIKIEIPNSEIQSFRSAKVEIFEVGEEIEIKDKVERVLDLYEQISDKKIEIELEKLEKDSLL